ncbi:MAG: radical SAM protein [Desulfobacteraceae bacterium]|nr:radical SAM protein [Desulfobacteraceae bacterium]
MGSIVKSSNRTLPHPCFDEKSSKSCGRIHLPVAPGCNIQCGYCSRDFDCVNESRPGVTSRVMEPEEAVLHLRETLAAMPYVTVAGIAGPGDAFCEPDRTLTTLALIRRAHPRLNLCLSTNGLNVGPHVRELADLGVGYVTVTVNAATPETGAQIYSRVMNGQESLRGIEGAGLLLERQHKAVASLKAAGITIKINMVVVSGVNEEDVAEVALQTSALGADIMNVIPVIAVPGTPLANRPPLSQSKLSGLREVASFHLPQMRHCMRCRADAAGLLQTQNRIHCHRISNPGSESLAAPPGNTL